jgi:hypothetical protein
MFSAKAQEGENGPPEHKGAAFHANPPFVRPFRLCGNILESKVAFPKTEVLGKPLLAVLLG